MNYEDLMSFTVADIESMACYVCHTREDVRPQDVYVSSSETISLAVCLWCRNAVSRVLALEDEVDDLENRLAQDAGRYDVEFLIETAEA